MGDLLFSYQTKVVRKTLNPVWGQSFSIDSFPPGGTIVFQVWDWDRIRSNDFLGECSLTPKEFPRYAKHTLNLQSRGKTSDGKITGSITIQLTNLEADDLPSVARMYGSRSFWDGFDALKLVGSPAGKRKQGGQNPSKGLLSSGTRPAPEFGLVLTKEGGIKGGSLEEIVLALVDPSPELDRDAIAEGQRSFFMTFSLFTTPEQLLYLLEFFYLHAEQLSRTNNAKTFCCHLLLFINRWVSRSTYMMNPAQLQAVRTFCQTVLKNEPAAQGILRYLNSDRESGSDAGGPRNHLDLQLSSETTIEQLDDYLFAVTQVYEQEEDQLSLQAAATSVKKMLADIFERAQKEQLPFQLDKFEDRITVLNTLTVKFAHRLDALEPNASPLAFSVDHLEAISLAEQLCLLDQEAFSSIRPSEFLNQAWTQANKQEKAPNLIGFIGGSTKLSNWVSSVIVSQRGTAARVRLIELAIATATHLKRFRNFAGVISILGGLSNTAIHRLQKTWAEVSPAMMEQLAAIKELFNSQRNFANYRSSLQSSPDSPTIPYIGTFLTDLVMIDDSHPAHLPEKPSFLNFQKFQKLSAAIQHLLDYQNQTYAFPDRSALRTYWENSEPRPVTVRVSLLPRRNILSFYFCVINLSSRLIHINQW